MHCFDDRYTAPAAVAFKTMLEKADPSCEYALHVVHEDITPEHMEMLREVVGRFPNASLRFSAPPPGIGELFASMKTRGHYSKEVLCKMVAPDIFPQYDRMVVTDVDVLYLGDISASFLGFPGDRGVWIAGVGYHGSEPRCRWIDKVFENCYGEDEFCEDERRRLLGGVGGGYLVCDLAAMRREGAAEKMLETFRAYAPRLKQAEQDVINLACAGKLLRLPVRNMVSTCFYDHLGEDEKPLWRETLENPVQLHYASDVKPWNSPGCTKAHLWWRELAGTPFFYETASRFNAKEERTSFGLFGIPLLKLWHTGSVSKARMFNNIRLREQGKR